MGYELVKLKEVADLKNGYAFKSKDYIEESENLLCRMGNIRAGGIFDLDYNPKYLPAEFITKYNNFILKDGDLIIAMTDLANNPKILGLPTIVETKGKNVFLNQRVGKLEILDKNVYIPYLKRALSSSKVRKYYSKFAGGGLQINIGKKEILDVEIPLPPKPIQIKIANALDKAQELIDNRKEQIEKYDELLQSVFLDMFGDPVSNPKGWEKEKLGEMGKFKNGLNYREKESGQQINFLGVGEFKKGTYLNTTKLLPKLELDVLPSKDYLLKDSDLIFVRSNGSKELVGRSILIKKADENATYSGFCIRYRNDSKNLEMKFFRSLLDIKSFKTYLKKDSRGANINNLNQQMLFNLEVILPPIHLQNQFAEIVEKIEVEKKKMEDSLVELENNFNSIMQRAFKGELF